MTDPLDDDEIEDDEDSDYGGPLITLETKSDGESKPTRRTHKTRAKKADQLVHKAAKGNASPALRHKA